MKFIFVAYDIKDDKKRTNLYKKLMYYGLVHVQYSAFKGYILDKDLHALIDFIKTLEIGEGEKVHIVVLCQRCQGDIIIFGKDPELRAHLII